jgi:hypothetical protein
MTRNGMEDERERFEERAAILEYCANLPRAEAERQAREMYAASAMGSSRGPRATNGAIAALNDMRRMLKR